MCLWPRLLSVFGAERSNELISPLLISDYLKTGMRAACPAEQEVQDGEGEEGSGSRCRRSGGCRMSCGRSSSRSSRSWTRRIGWARSGCRRGRSWTRSSIGGGRAASGTACRRSTRTIARSIGRSSAGSGRGVRAAVGGADRAVRGSRRGRLGVAGGRTGRWARPEKGGPCRAEPDRPGKGGVKRSLLVEGHGRPLAVVDRRRQCPGRPAPGGDHRGDGAGASRSPSPTGRSTSPSMPATTPRPAGRPPSTTTTTRTSRHVDPRIGRPRPTRRTQLAAGSWNARIAGWSAGAASSSAGRRSPRTTSASSSSPAPSSGSATSSPSPPGSAHDPLPRAIMLRRHVT